MNATIDYLPIWKKDSTAEEWLMECAAIARKHPERFKRVVIVLEEELPNGNTKTRTWRHDALGTYTIGMLEQAKMDLYEEMKP